MTEQAVSKGRRRPSGVTEAAIEQIRELIFSGEWGPGARLPSRPTKPGWMPTWPRPMMSR
jgi:hypothetical protein